MATARSAKFQFRNVCFHRQIASDPRNRPASIGAEDRTSERHPYCSDYSTLASGAAASPLSWIMFPDTFSLRWLNVRSSAEGYIKVKLRST